MRIQEVRPIVDTVSKLDKKTQTTVFKVWESAELDVIGDISLNQEGMDIYKMHKDKRRSLVTLQGKAVVDAFFKGDPSPAVTRFVEEFRKAYQREPETLEALSYDGAKLLREILSSKTISSPPQLKEELHQIQNYQGVSGMKGFGEAGKAIRSLSILRVNKGQIERVIGKKVKAFSTPFGYKGSIRQEIVEIVKEAAGRVVDIPCRGSAKCSPAKAR
jgi:hypothetical protein